MENNNNNDDKQDSIWHNLQKYANKGLIPRLIVGLAILMIVAQFTGLNPGTMFDRWFALKERQQEQSYDLQLKTFELINTDVLAKLDHIGKQLDDLDTRVSSLEHRVDTIEANHR